MKKLAIISSFNESCGNAAFTKVIRDSIHAYTQQKVEVIGLNLPLLQSSQRKERKLADIYINDLCKKLRTFDAVNIQMEAGLYGSIPSDIVKRVSYLATACPITSVTLHSPRLISQDQQSFRLGIKKILKLQLIKGLKILASSLAPAIHIATNRKILKNIIKARCKLIVHTLRAREQINNLYRYDNVEVHPLKMVEARKEVSSTFLPLIKKGLGIEENAIIIGMFGYISLYKGHIEALSALKHLPTNYKLMIFGRQHPQTIRSNQIDSYINLLVLKISKSSLLRGRVFFMGELNEKDFVQAASEVDIVWLPYHENGQDGSGIASICCDVAKRVLASSSFAFDELTKLIPYKNMIRFDIGNYLEMAQKTELLINQENSHSDFDPYQLYNTQTQAMLYVKDMIQGNHNL